MRKPENSVEPSMEEILASIRKIIAEEPSPAGQVAKEGEGPQPGGQPGGLAAPPGSDLSDLFDEPARDGADRLDAAKAPQVQQPDRRFGGPQAPFGPSQGRNPQQPPGGAQPSPLPGGNFLTSAPADQGKSMHGPQVQSEAGPAQPGAGAPTGAAPAGGQDLHLATRLKDLSAAGPPREVERPAQGPNPFANPQAPAGPGAPSPGAGDAIKAEQDRAGGAQPQNPSDAAAESARDGTGPADEGLPISVSIEQALSGSREASEITPEDTPAPAAEQLQNGASKFSQGVADSLAAIATPTTSGTPMPAPVRPVPKTAADPASQPVPPASHVVGPPVAVEEAAAKEPDGEGETVEMPETVEPPSAAANDAGQPVANDSALEEALTTLLRPVVHEWLNENMPALVEKAIAEKQNEQ